MKLHSRTVPIISIYVDPGMSSLLVLIFERRYILLYISHQSIHPGIESSVPPFAQIGLPLLPEPASQAEFTLLREWIHACDENHKCFPYQSRDDLPPMPTRVIDVGKGSQWPLRLVETKQSSQSKYVALSHCWGNIDDKQKLCTYRDNIEEHKKSIEYARLPPSFKDAVRVTRALGIRYLWIDSICVIQRDAKDWEAEAGRMESVFSSAYCTIAATSAQSSEDGFLHRTKPRNYVCLQTPSGDKVYFAENIDDFHTDVEEATLNTRGWVLQERALSRRSIHFASNQIYWECGKGVRCETLTKLTKYTSSL